MSNEEIDLRLKDPNHETTDSSYVTTLMEHMEYLKEEIKTKLYFQSLSNQYNYTYNDNNNGSNNKNNRNNNNNNKNNSNNNNNDNNL